MNEKFLLLDFKHKFKAYLTKKLIKLESKIISTENPENTALLQSFAKAVTHVLKGESSLTRPLLIFSSCRCFNVSEQSALKIAFCIELIHSMSLIIDDLPSMDNADTRRTRLTTHKVYGEGQAILAAFSLYTHALKTFAEIDGANLKEIMRALLRYLQHVIRGQAIDISLSSKQATLSMVDEMHILKTGFLIRACIVVPALLSPVKEKHPFIISALESIANSLGLAYQIRDDLWDALLDATELGKTNNIDLIQQKPSYVRLIGIEQSMTKLMELFIGLSAPIQILETTDKAYDPTLLKLLIEQIWLKSLELKTFFPTQLQHLEQHASLIIPSLKAIGRMDPPTNYVFHYAYGICFPLYSPQFVPLAMSFTPLHEQVEQQLKQFIEKNHLYQPENTKNELIQNMPAYLAESRFKRWQSLKLGTLVSLATNTTSFLKNLAYLPLITDFSAYIVWLVDQSASLPKRELLEANQQILKCFKQDTVLSYSVSSQYQAAVSLGLRLRTIVKQLYGENTNYEVITQELLQSLSELLEKRVNIKPPHSGLHLKGLSKRQEIMFIYPPIIRLTYLLLGIPQFHRHPAIPAKQLEEKVSNAITKMNAFMSLRADLIDAGFHLSDISHFYTSNTPLTIASNVLVQNSIIFQALQTKRSLKQTIFKELADCAQLVDTINTLISQHTPFCTLPEKEALQIQLRWASFANILWSLLNEQYVENHELNYYQFQALFQRDASLKESALKDLDKHSTDNEAQSALLSMGSCKIIQLLKQASSSDQSKKSMNNINVKDHSEQYSYIYFDMGTFKHSTLGNAKLEGSLLCPKAVERNRHVEAANRQSIEWATRMGLVTDEKSHQKLEEMRFAAMASSALCQNSVEDLQLLVDYVTCFVILDDIIDKYLPMLDIKVDQLEAVTKVFLDILKGHYSHVKAIPSQVFPLYNELCQAIFDISQRLTIKSNNLHYFIKNIDHYFRGILTNFTNQFSKIQFSEQTYLHMRRLTLGTKTAFELCCIFKGLNLSTEVRRNAIFKRITEAGLNVLFLLNDIISFPKEVKEQSAENLILIKLNEYEDQLSPQQNKAQYLQNAFNAVIKFHNNEMYDFLTLAKALPATEPLLQDYYNIVLNFVRNNIDWHLKETKRYALLNIKFKELETSIHNQSLSIDSKNSSNTTKTISLNSVSQASLIDDVGIYNRTSSSKNQPNTDLASLNELKVRSKL